MQIEIIQEPVNSTESVYSPGFNCGEFATILTESSL